MTPRTLNAHVYGNSAAELEQAALRAATEFFGLPEDQLHLAPYEASLSGVPEKGAYWATIPVHDHQPEPEHRRLIGSGGILLCASEEQQ